VLLIAALTMTAKVALTKQDGKEPSKLFIEKAREIGADEERLATDKLMERLAKAKPEPRKSSEKK